MSKEKQYLIEYNFTCKDGKVIETGDLQFNMIDAIDVYIFKKLHKDGVLVNNLKFYINGRDKTKKIEKFLRG